MDGSGTFGANLTRGSGERMKRNENDCETVMSEPTAGLAETLRALRAELNEVASETPTDGIVFDLGETEVELQVAVTKEGGADGGVRLGVVSFGAKGAIANESTHRVSVTLQPMIVHTDTSGKKTVTRAQVADNVTIRPK